MGISASSVLSGDSFSIDLLAHEIGHQLGATHTFNGINGSCGSAGQYTPATAYEPGSGTTIMSYGGTCGTDNILTGTGTIGVKYPMFNSSSISQIAAKLAAGCGATETTSNHLPVVVPFAASSWIVPTSTPFRLLGVWDDEDFGDFDGMTGSWEQADLGPAVALGPDTGANEPLFGVFMHNGSGERFFPQLSDILTNTTTAGEYLPQFGRSASRFEFVVRDNVAGAGGTAVGEVTVQFVSAGSGFEVTQPVGGEVFCGGSSVLVAWNPAGTAGRTLRASGLEAPTGRHREEDRHQGHSRARRTNISGGTMLGSKSKSIGENNMDQRVCIPEAEYQQRVQKAAALVQQRGLDVLVANSNEADYANVRYFSNFWPLFETAGVAISPLGRAALMVGPESLKYSSDRSMIQNIFQLMEYRESADPAYPELQASTFTDAFKSIGVQGKRLKIGIGGYLVSNPIQLAGLKECYPEAEIVRADDVMVALRSIKSENEIACIREGLRITEIATREVIHHIQPGMTELQLVGIAQKTIYENGAEYEGLPMYVFSEKSTRHAISRSTYREIQKGDIVQLNLSAKVDGYSPSIGMPVSMGRLTGRKKEIVDFGLEAHRWTYDQLKAGVVAADVAKEYIELFKKRGYYDNYLYGPCHGTGLIEVESPWMESISNYHLAENRTFQVDTFVSAQEFGIRWETGIAIRKDRAELLSQPIGKIFEIGV